MSADLSPEQIELREQGQMEARRRQAAEAAEIVRTVLDDLGITEVVFVDDQLAFDADDALLELRTAVEAEQLTLAGIAQLFPTMSTDSTDADLSAELAPSVLDERWAELTVDEQASGFKEFQQRIGPEGLEDSRVANVVALFEDAGASHVDALTPEQWNERRSQLVENARNQQGGVLFLFDNDLGGGPTRKDEGSTFLRSLAADLTNCVFVLVSHNFDEKTEHADTIELAKDLPKHARVIAVAKSHIDNNPVRFARRIRAVALFDTITAFVDRVGEAFRSSLESTREQVLSLAPAALERALVNSPPRLNITEPDVIARLFFADLRYKVEDATREDSILESLTAKLRGAVSPAGADHADAQANEEFRQFGRRENYIEFAHLTRMRMPLGTGDVFRVVPFSLKAHDRPWLTAAPNEQYFLLVEQDCDLELRSDGQRSRDLASVKLLRLAKGKADGKSGQVPLPRFCPSSFEEWHVDHRDLYLAPSLALDLAAMHPDGLARTLREPEPPRSLTNYWRLRHQQLHEECDTITTNYTKLTHGVTSRLTHRAVLRALHFSAGCGLDC